MDLNGLFSYLNHYGARSFLFSFYEKKLLDRKRFRGIKGEPPRFLNAASVSRESDIKVTPISALEDRADEKAKRKILYLVHHFYPDRRGGTERFVFNMARQAQKEGHAPLVLVLDFNLPLSAYSDRVGNIFYRSFEYMGVSCVGFRHKKAPLGLYYKRVDSQDADMRRFARFIFKEKGIDFIHAAYPQSFAPMLAEAQVRDIPYIVTLTDFALFCHYANMVKKDGKFCSGSKCGEACRRDCSCKLVENSLARYKEAEKLLFGARGIFVPSEFSRRVYMNEFSGLSVSVIPHGINESFTFKKRSGKPKKILYVGGKAKHKGLSLLLDAFCYIENIDLHLTVVGTDKTGRVSDERIKFIKSVPQEKMPELYAEADMVVVPSLFYESYNFAAREAIACGALAVCADIGAMSEAVDDGKNGFLFKAGDKEALVSALRRALNFELSCLNQAKSPTVREEFVCYESYFN